MYYHGTTMYYHDSTMYYHGSTMYYHGTTMYYHGSTMVVPWKVSCGFVSVFYFNQKYTVGVLITHQEYPQMPSCKIWRE